MFDTKIVQDKDCGDSALHFTNLALSLLFPLSRSCDFASPDDPVIFGMSADPNPREALAFLKREGAELHADAD